MTLLDDPQFQSALAYARALALESGDPQLTPLLLLAGVQLVSNRTRRGWLRVQSLLQPVRDRIPEGAFELEPVEDVQIPFSKELKDVVRHAPSGFEQLVATLLAAVVKPSLSGTAMPDRPRDGVAGPSVDPRYQSALAYATALAVQEQSAELTPELVLVGAYLASAHARLHWLRMRSLLRPARDLIALDEPVGGPITDRKLPLDSTLKEVFRKPPSSLDELVEVLVDGLCTDEESADEDEESADGGEESNSDDSAGLLDDPRFQLSVGFAKALALEHGLPELTPRLLLGGIYIASRRAEKEGDSAFAVRSIDLSEIVADLVAENAGAMAPIMDRKFPLDADLREILRRPPDTFRGLAAALLAAACPEGTAARLSVRVEKVADVVGGIVSFLDDEDCAFSALVDCAEVLASLPSVKDPRPGATWRWKIRVVLEDENKEGDLKLPCLISESDSLDKPIVLSNGADRKPAVLYFRESLFAAEEGTRDAAEIEEITAEVVRLAEQERTDDDAEGRVADANDVMPFHVERAAPARTTSGHAAKRHRDVGASSDDNDQGTDARRGHPRGDAEPSSESSSSASLTNPPVEPRPEPSNRPASRAAPAGGHSPSRDTGVAVPPATRSESHWSPATPSRAMRTLQRLLVLVVVVIAVKVVVGDSTVGGSLRGFIDRVGQGLGFASRDEVWDSTSSEVSRGERQQPSAKAPYRQGASTDTRAEASPVAPSRQAPAQGDRGEGLKLPAVTVDEGVARGAVHDLLQAGAFNAFDRFAAMADALQAQPHPATGDRKRARQLNEDALTALRQQQWGIAVDTFTRAAALDPADQEVADNLGYALRLAGRYEESSRQLTQVLYLWPKRESAWANFASTASFMGRAWDAKVGFWVGYRVAKNPDQFLNGLRRMADKATDPRERDSLGKAIDFIETQRRG